MALRDTIVLLEHPMLRERLGKATYVADKFGQVLDPALEWKVLRQQLVEVRPGWTLDYVDNMSWCDVEETLAYLDGVSKARAK